MSQICRVGTLLTAIFAAAFIITIAWKPAPAAAFHKIDASKIPTRVGAYTGVDIPLDEGTREALSSAQVIDRRYMTPDGDVVAFALIGGADRDALHDPRSCIVGAGGRIDNDRTEVMPGFGFKIRACEAIFTGSDGQDNATIGDTVFFYVTRSGIVADATKIRAQLLLTAFEQKGEPVFFVRAMVPVSASASADVRQAAHKRLLAFTSKMWRCAAPVVMDRLKS